MTEPAHERRLNDLLATHDDVTLATAESCSGGGVAARVTSVAGSSIYFLGGVVAYANDAKADVLGVPRTILETRGAVSPECAAAMAEGARRLFGATLAVSTTGIAGPGGGTPRKPVGLVYLALAGADGGGRAGAVDAGRRSRGGARRSRLSRRRRSVRGGDVAAEQAGDQPPAGDDRPDAFEQKKAPLPFVPGERGQNRRTDQIESEIRIGALVEEPELGERESAEHHQRADHLERLIHGDVSVRRLCGPGTAHPSSGTGPRGGRSRPV
jgi:PncC family amidohydrolase